MTVKKKKKERRRLTELGGSSEDRIKIKMKASIFWASFINSINNAFIILFVSSSYL